MSTATATVEAALRRGAANRPVLGGFPYLAASLWDAGVGPRAGSRFRRTPSSISRPTGRC